MLRRFIKKFRKNTTKNGTPATKCVESKPVITNDVEERRKFWRTLKYKDVNGIIHEVEWTSENFDKIMSDRNAQLIFD